MTEPSGVNASGAAVPYGNRCALNFGLSIFILNKEEDEMKAYRSNYVKTGCGLKATIIAAHAYVNAWHTGTAPAPVLPPHTPRGKLRYTPSFLSGRTRGAAGSKPYTARAISDALGITRHTKGKSNANLIVSLALTLLELLEKGKVTRQQVEDIVIKREYSMQHLLAAANEMNKFPAGRLP